MNNKSGPTEYDTGSISEAEIEDEPSVISGEIIEPEETEVVPDEPLFPAAVEEKLKEVRSRVESAEQSLPDDTIISMLLKLYEHIINVEKKTEHLDKEFQGKLKYDAHKDKIIDNLHQDLQAYKDDLLKKYLKNFVMDIIYVIDNIRRLTSHYASLPLSEKDPIKLLSLMESIPSDLEDIFSRQGIRTFTCDNNIFDPRRQRMLKKAETNDPSKDKTVAESLRPGYEWDEQIIRPEMVAVYVYQADAVKT
ncbi:MAG TPA: nucleotide exchange factor GrpE [Desulfobacteraceae bacterium]|nr:nucleotide exchange factor GrpE [Desulfobacteraceae bacterium]